MASIARNGLSASMTFRSVWAVRRAAMRRKMQQQKKIRAERNYFLRRDKWTSPVHLRQTAMQFSNSFVAVKSNTCHRGPGGRGRGSREECGLRRSSSYCVAVLGARRLDVYI